MSCVAGSYRDPRGHVFIRDERVFRTVEAMAADDFDAVRRTGLLDRLVESGRLVRWWEAEAGALAHGGEDAALVLEHERLPFISYPYEWSFSMLQEAALLHLDVQLESLNHGIALTDASAYNVQFKGTKPIFIDHLSFRPYREGEFWFGHKQFCEQFLNPLLLQAVLGVPFNRYFRGGLEGVPAHDLAAFLPLRAWFSFSILTHVILQARLEKTAKKRGNQAVSMMAQKRRLPKASFEHMLRGLRKQVAGLRPKGHAGTVWSDYGETHSYRDSELRAKEEFVRLFIDRAKPRMVLDIGCNTGHFSALSLTAGAELVVGFESDVGALEQAFGRARSERLNFLPLYQDAADPSPGQGWMQTERADMGRRAKADAVLALAVVHHLAIGRNIPLRQIVAWIIDRAPEGVIEFVPRSDPMVVDMLALREDIFADYTEENFDRFVADHAHIIAAEKVSATGRKLIAYSRN